MTDASGGAWHPDPTGRHQHRWWDGTAWTDQVADGGVTGTDPLTASPAPMTAQPVAGAPAAPFAGAPVAASGGGANFKIIGIVGAAVIALIIVVVLVVGGDDESGKRDQFVAGCTSDGTLSRSVCECVLDELIDAGHSLDELEEAGNDIQGDGFSDPELTSDTVEAFLACQ